MVVGCWLSCGHQVVHRVRVPSGTAAGVIGVHTLWRSRCARRAAVVRCRQDIEVGDDRQGAPAVSPRFGR